MKNILITIILIFSLLNVSYALEIWTFWNKEESQHLLSNKWGGIIKIKIDKAIYKIVHSKKTIIYKYKLLTKIRSRLVTILNTKFKNSWRDNLKWKQLFIYDALMYLNVSIVHELVTINIKANTSIIFDGSSMLPNIEDLTKLNYTLNLSKIKRNDIVIFYVSDFDFVLVKRVIAVWWDTLKIVNWKVFLKKDWDTLYSELSEKFLNNESNWNTKTVEKMEKIYKIPKNKFFMMWDNRQHSSDSRTCFSYSCSATSRGNFIDKKDILGIIIQ